jgi:thiol-disulfide isomerase/thioredoxin
VCTVDNPKSLTGGLMILMIFTMSFSGILFSEKIDITDNQLNESETKSFANSPGHSVFGEYVGAEWCGPCMSSASPSLTNLKTSNPEDFTFVSFFQANGNYPDVSPLNRIDHVTGSSSGIPVFSFADRQSGTCFKVGSAGTNYYDSDYSNGGCMSSDSNDYDMQIHTSFNQSTNQVTTSLDVLYVGSSSVVTVYVYGAITEKIGADAYNNGNKPHHNFRQWLLNNGSDGFTELTLSPNSIQTLIWETPLSDVRPSSGLSQWENFWPVFALMDGPHDTYNSVITAIDLDMIPMIDVGISDFSVTNQYGGPGFQTGDLLDIELEITNNGVNTYSDGGIISIYLLDGSEEVFIESFDIVTLEVSETQDFLIQFDTSDIPLNPSDSSVFRAILSYLEGDRNSNNNYLDSFAYHDLPPIANRPTSTSQTVIDRGEIIQFESSALPNDLVDDMSTMQPYFEYSKSSLSNWDDSWITDVRTIGGGHNMKFIHTLQTDIHADTGNYDIRIKWIDSSGQYSDWLVVEKMFELRNSLPRVLDSDDADYRGMPVVKVEMMEKISLNDWALVVDSESHLSDLSIESNDPEFYGWNPSTLEMSVKFDRVIWDNGNSVPQGIFVSISDGEDTNNGMIMFNVVENGAPRWSPISSQSINEGSSFSMGLSEYLTDTDSNGTFVSPSNLILSILSNSNDSLVDASISGQSITVSTLDFDSFGAAEIILRASDGVQFSDTSIVFHVLNINDPPTIDVSQFSHSEVKLNEMTIFDFSDFLTDVDDPTNEIWTSVSSNPIGAATLDPISHELFIIYDVPGTKTITLSATDRHGASTINSFYISVMSNKILTWNDEYNIGDLSVSFDSIAYGSDPIFQVENIGEVQLSSIKITWNICNGVTGICHSYGTVDNLDSFSVIPQSGSGLVNGDYITLDVDAVDSEGWIRETPEKLKFYANKDTDMNSGNIDSDGDGVIDLHDAFPNNPDETEDMDGNGVGDNGQYRAGQSVLPGFSVFLSIISILGGALLVSVRKNS